MAAYDQPEPDWTLEGDDRPRALDAVDRAIARPSAYRAPRPLQDEIEVRRAESERALAEVDARLATLIARRRGLVDRIRSCNLAIVGTGENRDHRTGALLARLHWHRRIPFADPQPELDVGVEAPALSGHTLRDAILNALAVAGQPLTIAEIERLLRLEGVVVAGRSSQTISNALRVAVVDGTVERIERGLYRRPT